MIILENQRFISEQNVVKSNERNVIDDSYLSHTNDPPSK